ncbi:hypothetical protein BJX70DRAFT_384823 [Aspergillus crustosus]
MLYIIRQTGGLLAHATQVIELDPGAPAQELHRDQQGHPPRPRKPHMGANFTDFQDLDLKAARV